MSWNYSVQLSDPSNVGGSADATLVYDIQQALSVWSQYIIGMGTLVVALNIQNTTQGRESGGPTSSAQVGTNGGLTVWESSAEYELTTGNHVSGTTSDITISIDPGYFQYLDLAAGLTYASQVPSNLYNPIVVFLHELMHGFGMTGYYDQTGTLAGAYESNFDRLISKTGSGVFFTGANAVAAYGGAVPLTSNSSSGENYYHFGNQQSDRSRTPATVQDPLTDDLMNGIVFFYDYQYPISNLDLAVLKDLGYSIRTVPVVAAHNVTATRNQSFNAASLFSVSMASGDSITAYQFWDSAGNPTGGHWVVGGSNAPIGQAIDVTPAQLASATFVSGSSGSDHLWVRASDGVYWSAWQDFYVNTPVDHAPVVTMAAFNVSAGHGQTFAAGSLFSVSDADGDTITAYQFWDSTADAASGYWVVGGAQQAAGQAINVTPAQLTTASFHSGSGSDHLWVNAFDGILWSGWQEFYVNAPVDNAPVVTPLAAHISATRGQSLAMANLVSVTDADHDAITAYQFWDSTPDAASGYWVVGGAQQPAGQAINVTPAQFSSATFQSGSGSDDLWMRASDGTMWGAWREFFVDAPIDRAPVVTPAAHNISATHGQSFTMAGLVSVSDADHDAITAYQFWDSTSDPASGYWVVGGAQQPAGQAINVTAAQFSSATFQTGSGSDDLWMRASDGIAWGAWQEFFVTAPLDQAPVVSGSNTGLVFNTSIAASSLFSAVDADHDTISQYELWDSANAASSAHFVVGSTAQPAGQGIFLSTSQFNQTSFVASSSAATDRLWARAYDGSLWGDWTAINVTSHA